MAHPGARALLLRDGDQAGLSRLVRASSVPAGLAQRARIVLLASEGLRNAEIAERVGVSRPTVNLWRLRYLEAGVAGLVDGDRSGRPKRVDERDIIAATLTPPPVRLGVTHWSSRLLGSRLKLDHATALKAWRAFGVTPWRAETFKFSTDPDLVAKVTDVIGLYLAPRRTRSCCVSTRRRRSRRWTGPRRRCRCSPATPTSAATTTSATAPPHCSRHSRTPPAGSPASARTGTVTKSSWPSSSMSPVPTPTVATGFSCTW